MARRRMLNIDLILDDDFTQELSAEAQNMYIYLNMLADDDGIVAHLKRQLRMLGKDPKYVNELIKHGYLISFDDETVVITDWLNNNHIRSDAYNASHQANCRSLLYITYKWQYTFKGNGKNVLGSLTDWINGNRQINGTRYDHFDEIALKEIAKNRYLSLKNNDNPSMEQSWNNSGTNMEQGWDNAGTPGIGKVAVEGKGKVTVKDQVAVEDQVLNKDPDQIKDQDQVPTTQQTSSNGGSGEILLSDHRPTSTKYNNATSENGEFSGVDSGVIKQNINSDKRSSSGDELDPECIQDGSKMATKRIQELTPLFDSLNQAFNVNLSVNDKRLSVLFDDLLNQYKTNYIQDGITQLASTSTGQQTNSSVKALVVNHLSESIKQVIPR